MSNVMEGLRRRYSGAAWAFMTEVPNGTGGAKSRSADAIAMSLWPSRGLHLHGFEMKVSRSDWLRELKDPKKADDICCYCDYWWVAVSDPDIVKPEELPKTWGLLVPRGKDMIQKVEAPKLVPIEMDRCFLAGMLRRAIEQLATKPEVEIELRKRWNEGIERGRESAKGEVERAQNDLKRMQDTVKEFETQSGLHLSPWGLGNIGRLVKLIGDVESRKALIRQFEQAHHTAQQNLGVLDEALKELKMIEATHAEQPAAAV